MKSHTSPFLCIEGTPNNIKQMVVIGEKKVLTSNMADLSITEGLLTLVSCYYAYQLEYPKKVGQVMVFLAKFLAQAPFEKTPSTVFLNLTRSINQLVCADTNEEDANDIEE